MRLGPRVKKRADSSCVCAGTQREELANDKGIDGRPVRVRTARMFLDGFAGIQQGQAGLDLPIFAAMSPTDQVRS